MQFNRLTVSSDKCNSIGDSIGEWDLLNYLVHMVYSLLNTMVNSTDHIYSLGFLPYLMNCTMNRVVNSAHRTY